MRLSTFLFSQRFVPTDPMGASGDANGLVRQSIHPCEPRMVYYRHRTWSRDGGASPMGGLPARARTHERGWVSHDDGLWCRLPVVAEIVRAQASKPCAGDRALVARQCGPG